MVIDLFALGIVNFGELRSVANTLQERCFTSVRPADHKDSEATYAIEVLFDFRGIELNLSRRTLCDWHAIGIRGGIELNISRITPRDWHVIGIEGGIELDHCRKIFCDCVIGIRTRPVYSKLGYYSLVLNGKAANNLRIDSGAMILAI